MANRKKKRKPKNSNVTTLENNTTNHPKSVERDIERFKFYSVVVHTIGILIVAFKDGIVKIFTNP